MVEWIEPSKTIGIIGGGLHAYHLTLAAKRLGYTVGILSENRNCLAGEISDWVLERPLKSEAGFDEFSMNTDVVIYTVSSFNSNYVNNMRKTVSVPQGEDLLSVSQDRILQKVFFESLRINIAPYATVLTLEDIKSSADSIGYPCLLKSNHADEELDYQLLLKSEADLKKAELFLERGSCVLETWLEVERRLVVNLIKDQYKNITTFPVMEVDYHGKDTVYSTASGQLPKEVEEEVLRLSKNVSDQFSFTGCLSVELLMTSNGFLYVDELSTQPHESLNWTRDFASVSIHEAQIKASCGMPLPESIKWYSDTVTVPFYAQQMPEVYQQMQIKPEWIFTFYPEPDTKDRAGYIVIPTSNVEMTLDLLQDIVL